MNRRTTLIAGASVLALPLLLAAPAQASHYDLDTMADNMMTAADASTVGVAGNHVKEFINLSGSKESPLRIWLCDLEGTTEIEVDGPMNYYAMTYASDKKNVENLAQQELFEYASEDEARKVMKQINKLSKKCEGTFTVKHDGGWTSTQKVSHGTGKTSDGAAFVWIKHTNTVKEQGTGVAEHEYSTFRQVGPFIQTVEIDVEGVDAPRLNSSQIKGINKLTGPLGNVWG